MQERHLLPAVHLPHVVVATTGAMPACIFQNDTWSRTLPEIVVFDDTFVAESICSGIQIEAGHRQKLHELILGAQGVSLNATVQAHVEQIEEHNGQLRELADAIPATTRWPFQVEDYCALAPMAGIAVLIREAERAIAAAKESEPIQRHAEFVAHAPAIVEVNRAVIAFNRAKSAAKERLPRLGIEFAMVMVGLSGMGCEHSHSREILTGHGHLDRCAPAAKSCGHRGRGRFHSFFP